MRRAAARPKTRATGGRNRPIEPPRCRPIVSASMLVGVPSYRRAVALQRRDAIREMGFVGSSAEANARAELLPSCVSPACTWLRFVMA